MEKPYRLTPAFVRRVDRPGLYGDGRGSAGLQLRVHRTRGGDVSKSWRQMLLLRGRPTTRGLGAWPHVSLADARKAAQLNKATVLVASAHPVVAPVTPRPTGPTVLEALDKIIELRRPGWSGPGTEAAWRRTLSHLGSLGTQKVAGFASADVLAVVTPLWGTKNSVARAVLDKARLAADWAIGQGLRSDNPARVAKTALPRQAVQTEHFEAVPVKDAPTVYANLEASNLLGAPLVRFIALTGVRHQEASGALWNEIDLDAKTWVVPASRMKSRRTHRVPLSEPAITLLRHRRKKTRGRGLVFRNTRGKPVPRDVCARALRRVTPVGTPHGWRTTLRSWAADQGFSREVAEECLAHKVGGVEGVYRRETDLYEIRHTVMNKWGEYLARP